MKKEFLEITPFTLAIVSEQDENGRYIAKVLEEEMEYVLEAKPTNVIDYACKYFGASLKGRQEGTREISGITHKAPITIDPASGMYFFPTKSPSNANCSWIAHSHIKEVRRGDEGTTSVLFKNGSKISLDISHGSLINQLQRTAQIRFLLDDRIKRWRKPLRSEDDKDS
ncbi:competence protein [Oceanobacillus sp. E9]|uniref:competence protein ComK n=1 Tax=Oceanobacillus TaxID=182709 RepID=UPI00084E8C4E|nr:MULTISPECIES: competence protein ComK [Oceanobacillus]OEH54315.1 competence protein [Oceanobacillus sp. E9]